MLALWSSGHLFRQRHCLCGQCLTEEGIARLFEICDVEVLEGLLLSVLLLPQGLVDVTSIGDTNQIDVCWASHTDNNVSI